MRADTLQYNTLGRWVNGMTLSLTKHLMFQVSFFFIIFCKILFKNLFSYFFYNFKKIKRFECPKSKPANHCFIFNLLKKNTWTIRAWSMRRLTQRPQRIILKIVGFVYIYLYQSRFNIMLVLHSCEIERTRP